VVCAFALQVGDVFRYVWRGPDGSEMGMRGVVREIVPPERLVATEKFDEPWYPGEAVGTIILVEQGGKTALTQTILYESREARDVVLKTPIEHGVAMGHDRLAELLASLIGSHWYPLALPVLAMPAILGGGADSARSSCTPALTADAEAWALIALIKRQH
jgi:Activator of Hsp90 ATPase homolog 1-like protein